MMRKDGKREYRFTIRGHFRNDEKYITVWAKDEPEAWAQMNEQMPLSYYVDVVVNLSIPEHEYSGIKYW